MMPVKMVTDRLVLRKYTQGDSGALLTAVSRNREHLREYESDNAILSITDAKSASKLIANLETPWKEGKHFFLGMFSKETGDWIGQVYVGEVDPDVPEYRIGYIADVHHEGQGYVSEAAKKVVDTLFTEMGAYRISIECDDTNSRSVAVAERCGFLREGHLRKNRVYPDGTRTGTMFYGLLKE